MAIISNFPAGGGGSKSLNNAVITLATSSFVYDGTEKNQQIQSVVLNGTTLHEGVDYLVTGNLATEAGTHTISVLGIMDYGGVATATWSIAKAQGSVSVSPASLSITGGGSTDTFTVTVVGDGTVSVTSTDTSIATAILSGSTVTVTVVGAGTATVNVTLAEGTNYLGSMVTVAVSCSLAHVYGVSWDGTSTTAWTRTDDAADFTDPVPYVAEAIEYGSPFDNRLPWSGMQIVEDTEAGTLVSIPKFWYTLTQNGAGMKIQIADGPLDGFHVSPAHMDRGDGKGERDVVYIGRYHCDWANYKSRSGNGPYFNATRPTFRAYIHNLGSTIWQADFALRFTLFLLYLVEFADWNSQAKIGCGCGDNNSTTYMGYTDSMPYHTGTMQSNHISYGYGTQYRYIEGLWDNVYDWVDGCVNTSSGLKLILNPANFSDSDTGIAVGTPNSGYPTAFSVKDVSGTFPLFIPSAANGSDSTYSCDYWSFSGSYPCVCSGSDYMPSSECGLFYFRYGGTSGTSNGTFGSRLMKLP